MAAAACITEALLTERVWASADACDPTDVALTTTPAAPYLPTYMQRHQQIASHVPPSADVVLVGDSITQGWPTATANSLFGTPAIFNFGVNADRTQNVLWRLSSTPGIERLRPRTVVVLIGTNNLAEHDQPCAIVAGIQAVLAKTQEVWHPARTIVLQILPRGSDFRGEEPNRGIVNAQIPKILPDQGRFSVVNADVDLTCRFTQGCLNYRKDSIHLTQAGYDALAAAMTPTVRR